MSVTSLAEGLLLLVSAWIVITVGIVVLTVLVSFFTDSGWRLIAVFGVAVVSYLVSGIFIAWRSVCGK